MYWKHWVKSSLIQDHSNISIFLICSRASHVYFPNLNVFQKWKNCSVSTQPNQLKIFLYRPDNKSVGG